MDVLSAKKALNHQHEIVIKPFFAYSSAEVGCHGKVNSKSKFKRIKLPTRINGIARMMRVITFPDFAN